MSRTLLTLLLTAAVLGFTGCDSDDPIDTTRQFTVTVENVGEAHPVLKSGAVAQPAGMLPAIEPGESASFSFTAPANTTPMSGMRLNLATMFVQSNDLFYAFRPEGLTLFDANGDPVAGDVTDQLFLYDAGTEVNEEPGLGPNQKPAQDPMAVDVGIDENGVVMLIEDGGTDVEGFSYPDKRDVIQVTIDHDGASTFTVTVANVSTPGTLDTDRADGAVPLSPVVWAAHVDGYTLYEVGEPASPGLEILAEDGFPADMLGGMDTPVDRGLADELADVTGVTVPLSPGAYAVHTDGFTLFEVGGAAPVGIERNAEDGDPMEQATALAGDPAVMASGVFDTPQGASEAGPIPPGGSYSFTVDAMPGDRLSLSTMYAQSNDYYYAFDPDGLDLFPNGTPVSGDQTAALSLYDAGTEGDEEPGVGPFQAPRQPAPNTGPDGEGPIVRLGDGGTNDGYTYPPNAEIIRVTISPQ